MRLHGRPTRKRRERITLNLASMIDVTFLILVYFLLTTVLIRPEDRLTSALQTQRDSSATISDFQPQVVQVLMSGGRPVYRVGGRDITHRAELAAMLASLLSAEGIFINVSDDVPVGFAVTAMQEAHNAGFEQVTYVPQR